MYCAGLNVAVFSDEIVDLCMYMFVCEYQCLVVSLSLLAMGPLFWFYFHANRYVVLVVGRPY